MVTFTVTRIAMDTTVIDSKEIDIDPANFNRLDPRQITERMPDGSPKTVQIWDCLNKWTSVYTRNN